MTSNSASVMANPTDPVHLMRIVGYRFHPTDEELVNYHLKGKCLGHDDEDSEIVEVNICNFEPWDLPGLSNIKSNDQVWYFFYRRDCASSKSRFFKRKTKAGYWKSTGKIRKVKQRRGRKEIGTKRTLVFHEGSSSKGVRTKWVMHEYECISDSKLPNQGNCVLCKLKKKPDEKINKGQPNDQTVASDFENQNPNEIMAYSASDESELSRQMVSDFGYHNPNETTATSTTSDLENQNFVSEAVGWSPPMTTTDFDIENHISFSDIDGEWSPIMGMPSNSNCYHQSTYEKGESTCLMAIDLENQCTYKIIDISAADEGESSRLIATPSDFENQNDEHADMSTPNKDDDWISTIFSHLQNKVTTFPQVDLQLFPQLLEEMKAFSDLNNSLNSAVEPPVSAEGSPSCFV